MRQRAAVPKVARNNVAKVARRSRAVVNARYGSGLSVAWPTGTPGEDA
jgi:hypothetical protein